MKMLINIIVQLKLKDNLNKKKKCKKKMIRHNKKNKNINNKKMKYVILES